VLSIFIESDVSTSDDVDNVTINDSDTRANELLAKEYPAYALDCLF
jgi:hypothetical protein